MKNENAKKGIGLIFSALILDIVGEVMRSLVVPIKILGMTWQKTVALVISIAAAVVMIVAAVQFIRGFIWAKKDEPRFKYGLVLISISAALVIIGWFASYFNWADIFSCFQAVILSGALFIMCDGIASIYGKLKREDRFKEGLFTGTMFFIAYGMGVTIEHIAEDTMMRMYLGKTGVYVFAIVGIVLMIIAFIKMIIYLNRARKEIE